MKKFFTVAVLVFLFLVTAITSQAAGETQAEMRMLNDLLGYLYNCEMIYSDLLWALDAFDKFDAQKNWENLQFARASLEIAKSDIQKRKASVPEMTAEDKKDFMKRGIDLSFFDTMDLQFNGEKTGLLTTCTMLAKNIMFEVFLEDDWEICRRNCKNEREILECDLQYLANTADWVLTILNNPDIIKKFNAVLAKNCPKTHSRQRKKPASLKEIEASVREVLNKSEKLVMKNAEILGAKNNRLNYFRDLVAKKNFELLRKNVMKIAGMPLLIICPSWISNAKFFYYWQENGKISKTPPARSKLQRIPDGVKIEADGVRLDEVKAWVNDLRDTGLNSLELADDNDKFTVFYKIRNSEFAVIWEKGTAKILMIKNPVCLVPILYLSVMR